jgi:hypothetical protein
MSYENTTDLESDIYDHVLKSYESEIGVNLSQDPFIYHEMIKIMETVKGHKKDPNKLKEVITNALVLILSLYFNKDKDEFDDEMEDSKVSQDLMKSLLKDVMDVTADSFI